MKELLLEIAHCSNIGCALADSGNHCHEVVTRQLKNKPDSYEFQVPEPWNGDLQNAPILFISSNPSIAGDECYPTLNNKSWPAERTIDFFTNRFDKDAGWVENYLGPLKSCEKEFKDKNNWVRFWAGIRGMARDILQREPIPGTDYAITEVVHCKSQEEEGVKKAADYCAQRYMPRILSASSAQLYVVVGSKARGYMRQYLEQSAYNLDKKDERLFTLKPSNKAVLFLPHPNARQKRKLQEVFANRPDLVTLLQDRVNQH